MIINIGFFFCFYMIHLFVRHLISLFQANGLAAGCFDNMLCTHHSRLLSAQAWASKYS